MKMFLFLVFIFFVACGDSGDDHWNNHFDVLHSHEHQHTEHAKPHRHSHEHYIEGGHASNEALHHYTLPSPKWHYGDDHDWLGKNLHKE